MPYLDNSLPNPLCLIPPKGTLGSEATILFTVTIPHSNSLDNFCALFKSRVQMLPPSPKSELFAACIASASSATTIIGATGPKVSSLDIRIFELTFFITVGL